MCVDECVISKQFIKKKKNSVKDLHEMVKYLLYGTMHFGCVANIRRVEKSLMEYYFKSFCYSFLFFSFFIISISYEFNKN